jgi:hypothetical protein
MPTIDHDQSETPRKRDELWWLWPLVFVVFGLLWAWFFYFETPHWVSLGLGFSTGAVFMAWTGEITGNRYPSSPRDKGTTD